MKFGLGVMQMDADPRVLADLTYTAEQAGWDGFFIWDRIIIEGEHRMPVSDTQVALNAIALATTRIHLGAMITPLARRHAVRLARDLQILPDERQCLRRPRRRWDDIFRRCPRVAAIFHRLVDQRLGVGV